MLFKCSKCGEFSFDSSCGICGSFEVGPSETVPVDPLYYPEFQYKAQGFVTDLFKRGKLTKELQSKLESVLQKYSQFESPYFVNYFHVGEQGMASGASDEIISFDLLLLKIYFTSKFTLFIGVGASTEYIVMNLAGSNFSRRVPSAHAILNCAFLKHVS